LPARIARQGRITFADFMKEVPELAERVRLIEVELRQLAILEA